MTTPRQRAAKAICRQAIIDRFGEKDWREGVLDSKVARYWPRWVEKTGAALAALAEPSEAMIEAIKSAWKTAHVSISDSGAKKIWAAAHAAMMAEKDTGE